MLNKNKIVSLLKQLKLTTDNSIVNELHAILTQLDAESLSVDDIQISTTVETVHLIDAVSLIKIIIGGAFNVEDWKSSFILSLENSKIFNGIYETSGDFSTEVSYANLVGLMPSDDETYKETLFGSANFRPTGGTNLNGIEDCSSIKLGGFDALDLTYRYEEDASATGSGPKYLHDFRLTIDSIQILGYVVINADDSEFHNFIIDIAAS